MLHFAATVIYVDDVVPVLDFYRAAFGCETKFFDPDVQLTGRRSGEKYEFAELVTVGGTLQFATPALGALLMPGFQRAPAGQPAGVEIAFSCSDVPEAFTRAIGAGAVAVQSPRRMPWGQVVAYVRSLEGTYIGLCSVVEGGVVA